MKRLSLIPMIFVGTMLSQGFAGELLPIRTEVFQEVSIDDMDTIPRGVSALHSIKAEPVNEVQVKYHIRFDSTMLHDTVPLEKRFAYQDLGNTHIFDFYNCFSIGTIDGISIRRYPVMAVDKNVYRSKNGTYVLRILFKTEMGAKADITAHDSVVTIDFKGQREIAQAAAAPVVKKEKKKSGQIALLNKKVLAGIGLTAIAGAAATYFAGKEKGEDIGREDAYAHPRSILPAFPSQEQAFPPEPTQ